MSKFGLRCLAPLHQTAARKTTIGLDDKRFDITVARLVGFVLLHQRRCRIAVSSLFIRIDGDRFLIPGLSLCVVPFLQVDVARKERCMIELWLEFKRLLIPLQRLVGLTLGEE